MILAKDTLIPPKIPDQQAMVVLGAKATLALQLLCFFFVYIDAPGYFTCYVHSKLFLPSLALLLGWEILGILLLWISLPVSKSLAIATSIFVLLFFCTPLTVAPFLGVAPFVVYPLAEGDNVGVKVANTMIILVPRLYKTRTNPIPGFHSHPLYPILIPDKHN